MATKFGDRFGNGLTKRPDHGERPHSAGTATLDGGTFDQLRRIIYNASGIHLKDAKRQMIQSRLAQRLRSLNLTDFNDYLSYLGQHPEELTELINRVTTNKTSFFREPHHFRMLKDQILPEAASQALAGGNRVINGWCAASSTGEEPHCIAMVLAEFVAKHKGWKARLLASDLDTNVLETARRGLYPLSAKDSLPGRYVAPFTVPGPGNEPGTFGFSAEVKSSIQLRQINLMSEHFPIRTPLDFVFCRNVFIYFTREDRDRVVDRFIEVLKPGGYLLLGHSEVLDMERFRGRIQFIGNTSYQKI